MMDIKDVYTHIAKEFDKTRRTVWKHVGEFLDTLEPGSFVFDNGCGNGKNMLYRDDLNMWGIDISKGQVEVCRAKGLRVMEGNMTELPFHDGVLDAVLCTASYHHLQTCLERQKALSEMYRCLKQNGKVLLTVWDSGTDLCEDTLVPWKSQDGITYRRYYRKYSQTGLLDEIKQLEPRFIIIGDVQFEKGNWFVCLMK